MLSPLNSELTEDNTPLGLLHLLSKKNVHFDTTNGSNRLAPAPSYRLYENTITRNEKQTSNFDQYFDFCITRQKQYKIPLLVFTKPLPPLPILDQKENNF